MQTRKGIIFSLAKVIKGREREISWNEEEFAKLLQPK